MKLIKRFQSGGGLTTAQGLASVFQGINLQQGLSGDARLGNMQVKDGMFNPAPPLYAPMIQTQQNNLLWQTNKQPTIPEENTAQPKSNIQVAQEGDKLQPNRFMDFIKRFFMGPPIEHKPYVQRPQPRNTYKIKEPLEPDVKSDMNTYSGGMLPGITVEAKDLSKPQRFPYGGINVISKPINGGLDKRQRVVVNPFEGHDLVASKQEGGPVERADNTKVQKPLPGIIPVNSEVRTYDNIPVRVKKGYPRNDEIWLDNPARPMYSPWKNIKLNGIYPSAHGVELDVLPPELMQKIDGNDTTYYVQGDNREYYPVVGHQARPQFREAFKNPKARQYKPNYFNTPEKVAKAKQVINRGIKKNQQGGLVESADNTSVASRPQLVKNKIPYGAGKGPAADSPMRLFNDPYVNMGLMAMGPIVSRSFALKDMNYTPKVPDNARAMGLGVRGLSRRTGKSPQEVIKIMSEKFGNPQVYTKAFDNSEPAYGWTFENPDHYRQALQLFNLK